MNKNSCETAKKNRVRMSDDTVLDMFRFFTRRELCSFKLVNRRMKRVIEFGDRKKQIRQRFLLHQIHFSVCFHFAACILFAGYRHEKQPPMDYGTDFGS
jgi:hypothetical protein